MCHVEISENLEGIYPGGLINRGKKKEPFKKVSFAAHGRLSFLEPDK